MFRPQEEFATNVFQLVTSFNGLSLTDTEVGLFAAIVLLTPDRPGVSDVKTVQHSQDRIVEAFKLQVSGIDASVVFAALITRTRKTVQFDFSRKNIVYKIGRHHENIRMILPCFNTVV